MAKRILDFKVGTVVSLIARPEVMMQITNETKSHWFLTAMSEQSKEWLEDCYSSCENTRYRDNYKLLKVKREGLRQRKHRFRRTWKYSVSGSVLFGGNIADRK